VLAWVSLPLQYALSLCLCVVGLAFAIVGMNRQRDGSRTLALVTLVASGVLLFGLCGLFGGALFYITYNY